MAYEVVMSYHLHMPSYFLGTFTEYPYSIRYNCNRLLKPLYREDSDKSKTAVFSLENTAALISLPQVNYLRKPSS